ncbi:hypothetical protein GPUN_0258 [Glaciecola punicea ACAM 611]|uniref:Uncharacterized protein n=2 Tax=Glaciecola TaxID=89404 RepID=H5T7Y4_9ALTE|nr:hypothetical protein GPUN_0258 [Glaciecola punicea ACAM 611]
MQINNVCLIANIYQLYRLSIVVTFTTILILNTCYMAHYFPKPAPLSPRAGAVERRNKKDKKYKGVDVNKSFYYLWFEYLKRSDKYKLACENNGKGMTKLYKDFGNLHSDQYTGELGFWEWWTEKDKNDQLRGERLFGIKGHTVEGFATNDELLESKDQIESGEVKVIILPTNVTRSTIERRLAKLLKQLVLNPTEVTARYHPSNLKVDVNSLEKCLKAYDMRLEGKTNVEIGAVFIFEDAQKVLKDADLKNKCNVGAYRLIKKAEANIKAVESGMFGVGH